MNETSELIALVRNAWGRGLSGERKDLEEIEEKISQLRRVLGMGYK